MTRPTARALFAAAALLAPLALAGCGGEAEDGVIEPTVSTEDAAAEAAAETAAREAAYGAQ